jgi:hypothetical protein
MRDANSDMQTYRSISELPTVTEGALGRAFTGWNRRQLLRRTLAGAVGLSLASLGLLPPARRAYAHHAGTDGYQIKPLPCPPYASDHNCSPGCGPSKKCRNQHCCNTNPSSHFFGWYRRQGRKWKLRKGQCWGSDWDGWRWAVAGSCGCCGGGLTYRCHDGYKCDTDGNNCVPRICLWTVNCEPPFC